VEKAILGKGKAHSFRFSIAFIVVDVVPRRRFFKLPVGECSASGVISALGDASDFYIHFDHFY